MRFSGQNLDGHTQHGFLLLKLHSSGTPREFYQGEEWEMSFAEFSKIPLLELVLGRLRLVGTVRRARG